MLHRPRDLRAAGIVVLQHRHVDQLQALPGQQDDREHRRDGGRECQRIDVGAIAVKVMLGKPVIRGTRVPVELLLRRLCAKDEPWSVVFLSNDPTFVGHVDRRISLDS